MEINFDKFMDQILLDELKKQKEDEEENEKREYLKRKLNNPNDKIKFGGK